MTKEFRYFSYLKLHSSVVTSCTKSDGKWKVAISRPIWLGTILSFLSNNQGTLLPYHECSKRNDITQSLKIVPREVTSYDIAWDYFKVLHHFLWIVDFDSNTTTSWRVFFSWLDVVKGFFFIMERILQSFTTVVLCGRPGLFMLLRSLVHCFSFFLRMYQTVDLATPNIPQSLWWICFEFEA